MKIEKRLKLLMKAKLYGVKSQDFARRLGCSKSWVSQFFSGRVKFPEESIEIMQGMVEEARLEQKEMIEEAKKVQKEMVEKAKKEQKEAE